MTVIRTACTYDCPDACGLLVEVDPAGVTIRGDPEHPITRGFVCNRIGRHPARLADPDRLARPRLRRGDGFEDIGWGQALDLAAEKLARILEEHGPAAVVHVFGGGSLGLKKELVGHYFRSLGPVTTLTGGVCDDCGKAAQRLDFGESRSHDYTDLENCNALVLWGKDPIATGVHLVPFLHQVKKRGKPLALVEVLPTGSRAYADRFIQLAPASDGWLALAVVRLLYDRGTLDQQAIERTENFSAFEKMLTGPDMDVDSMIRRADVERADVDYLAELYAANRPVATLVGWGLQRRTLGGRAVRCIDALGALTGNVGIPGGGVNYGPGRRRGLDLSRLAKASGRKISVPRFAEELENLTDPKAHFVYIHGANPVCQLADSHRVLRALRSSEFVVVADAFFTDTAEAADLILPVTLMLEEEPDVVGSYGHHHVARTQKVVDPPEGARDDLWIVREINRRLGRPEDPLLADPDEALRVMTAAWFPDGQAAYSRNPAQERIPYAERFDTPTGKMRLVSEPPGRLPAAEGFPLVFMTQKHRRYEHSQVPPSEQQEPARCFVHPQAPGAEKLEDRQPARVVSELASMPVRVHFDTRMRRDVCLVRVGGWLRFDRAVNALVAGRATDVGEGTAFYDQRVRLDT